MRAPAIFLVAFLALMKLPVSAAQDGGADPKQVIRSAIKAAGGKARLAQLTRYRLKTKGKFFNDDGGTADILAEVWREPPSLARIVIQIHDGENRDTILRIVNKESAWEQINGLPVALDAESVREMRHAQYGDYLTLLFPLLEEPNFVLKTEGETRSDGRIFTRVKVTCKGQVDTTLSFDKNTGLLARIAWPSFNPRSKGAMDEVHFDDYKEIRGVKFAHKVALFEGGKKSTETTLIELEAMKQIDPKIFAKPAN